MIKCVISPCCAAAQSRKAVVAVSVLVSRECRVATDAIICWFA